MRKTLLLGLGSLLSLHLCAQSAAPAWRDVAPAALTALPDPLIRTQKSRTLEASLPALAAEMATAPQWAPGTPGQVITLPDPEGGWQRFQLWQNDVFPEALRAKYPGIATFTAQGVDDPFAHARLDLTTEGFHAMVLTPKGTWYVDPYGNGAASTYQAYRRTDFIASEAKLTAGESMPLEWRSDSQLSQRDADLKAAGFPSAGSELRTYVIAISTTGEYTSFHGGTVPGALSAVTTTLNRVAGVYTVEFSVTFSLHPNNDTLIFTNPATDPFTNSDIGLMLDENQTVIDARIGNGNYDVGHIFGTEGGGLAYLGCVCTSGIKAQGGTGLGSPVGDPFDVDYVSHELGHQFDANHTWNYCYGGGEASHAYEPGSASTIMGYAGLCGPDDLQSFSHPQFHTHNFEEVTQFTQVGGGSGCPDVTPTGNPALVPVISIPSNLLPTGTPFKLTGEVSSPGDSVTYCWDEMDLGPRAPVGTPSGNAPIFRSWLHSPTSTRILPRIDELVVNTAPFGEILPTYGRAITFNLTVRDNLGAVGSRPFAFSVIAAAGPFEVTYPNFGGTTLAGGYTHTVTWDVANTDAAPINADSVSIYLSTNGGFTWPTLLAEAPNTGSAPVFFPDITDANCRIIIEGKGFAWFDMSNFDFTLDSSLVVGVNPPTGKSMQVSAYPQPASGVVNVQLSGLAAATAQWEMVNALGQQMASGVADASNGSSSFSIPVADMAAGMYWLRLSSGASRASQAIQVVH